MSVNPNVRAANLFSYGHSYTRYPGPWVTQYSAEYPDQLARALDMKGGLDHFRGRSETPLQDTLSGLLSSTLSTADPHPAGFQQWTPGDRGIVLLQNYANEGAGGHDSDAYLTGWRHALRTFMAVTGAASITTASQSTHGDAWNQLNGGVQNRWWNDDCLWSVDKGHVVRFQVTGDECWVIGAISTDTYGPNNNGVGDLKIYVNTYDTIHQIFTGKGEMADFTSAWPDAQHRTYSPAAFKVTGLNEAAGTDGTKTVIVQTNTDGANHFVNAVIQPMEHAPHVFVAKEPPRNPGSHGADNLVEADPKYRAAIDDIALEFPDRMHIVDLAPGWQNPEFVSSLDPLNIHPNDLGHSFIADRFMEAINAEITESIPGIRTL